MTPRIQIIAVLLAVSAPVLAQTPGAAGNPAADLEKAKAAARAQFMAHAVGMPTIESVVKLPQQPADQVNELRVILDSAREIELGCVAPCGGPADAVFYRNKVEFVATKLGLDAGGMENAVAHYLPQGKPRLRGAGAPATNSVSDKMLEARLMEQVLRDPHLDPGLRQKLGQKALAYADALGGLKFENGAGGAGGVAGGAGHGPLTAQQIANLSAIPRTQAAILRNLATKPPPPVEMTASERQEASMRECEEQIKNNPGTVRQARNFWIAESQDKSSNVLWRGYAYFNRGLLAVSGLTEVEESAARTGWATGSNDVSTRRAMWEGTKLGTNAVLFAANFVGFEGAGNVIKTARVLDKPVVVEGLGKVGAETAEQIAKHSEQISTKVAEALAEGGGKNYKAATQVLDQYAATELKTAGGAAFKVERGGKWGEAAYNAEKGAVQYSPMVGESHEFAHAVQMVTNRASALEVVASRTGKTVAQLKPGEVEEAMKLADNFEKAYYAQHEAQAFRSSGLLGLAPGKNFGAKLATNSAELAAAWTGKADFAFSGGQKFFGALSGMGHSQAQIGMTLLSHANVPYLRDKYSQSIDGVADLVSDNLLPEPTLPSQRKPK